MEAFMVADSTPDYPMMCDLELTFAGQIDRAVFERGLAFALARNPLFCCRIETIGSGPAWVPVSDPPPVKWVALDDPLDDDYGAPADFRSQGGLRVWVRQDNGESRVLLHFHHACADAVGSFGFIEDFLVGYHNAFNDAVPLEARPLEPERLLTRGEIGMGGRGVWRQITDVLAGAREGIKFFWQRPAPLAALASPPPNAVPPRPSFVTAFLSPATTHALRSLASQAGATTNDLLMRELFVMLARWNEAAGGCSPRRRLRILMPQNLRERDDYRLPLTNAMSFAFVTRRANWRERPAAFLESLREETEAVRRGKLSLYFLGALGSIRSAGLLRPLLRGPFCFATAVLSNLGDPSRRFIASLPHTAGGLAVGNLVYRHVLGVPPTRPRTHVVFTVANHGSTMSVTCKWDHHRYNPQDGRRILDDYVAQLDDTARQFSAGAPRSTPPALQ
jgi:hypothetical protein